MKVKELIVKLQQFDPNMEVGCLWDRQVRDGWQEMWRDVKGVEVRGVTGADVLCKLPKTGLEFPIFKVLNRVVIL